MGKEEFSQEIFKYTELNENENTTCQNMQMLPSSTEGEIIALNAYIRQQEVSNQLSLLPPKTQKNVRRINP